MLGLYEMKHPIRRKGDRVFFYKKNYTFINEFFINNYIRIEL